MCVCVCVCVCVLFQILFPYSLLQDIEYSSLHSIVGPSCLSILYTVVDYTPVFIFLSSSVLQHVTRFQIP